MQSTNQAEKKFFIMLLFNQLCECWTSAGQQEDEHNKQE